MWIENNSKLNKNRILCLLLLLALWNPREVDDDELMFPVAHVISAVNIVRLVKLGCFVKFFHQSVSIIFWGDTISALTVHPNPIIHTYKT